MARKRYTIKDYEVLWRDIILFNILRKRGRKEMPLINLYNSDAYKDAVTIVGTF